MKTLLNRPYHLFLLTAIIFFILSFFSSKQSVDINLLDTYFVISKMHLMWVLAILFLAGWSLYKLTNKFLLNNYLVSFHVLATIIIVVIYMTQEYWHDKLLPPVERAAVSYKTILEYQQHESNIYLPLTLIFVAGQIAYFVNLFGGLANRKKPR